jgi:hypothetical protein
MWEDELFCGIDPVVSLGGFPEPKMLGKRPESLLQLAAPNPINEIATTRDQMADLRDAHMMTRPHAKTPLAAK